MSTSEDKRVTSIVRRIKSKAKNYIRLDEIPTLRCIHRHTIAEHPNCFLDELSRKPDEPSLIKWPNDKLFERMTGNPWIFWEGYRIGYLDIEVDNLNANYGTMLSWAIKQREGDIVYDVVTKDDLFDPKIRDRKIVKSLMEEIKKYSILVTYYGTGFDIPFIRTKARKYKLSGLEYQSNMHHDLYYTVKSKYKLSSNSLKTATDYFEIPGKTPISNKIWFDAKYGEPYALEYVVDHNLEDVKITEALHNIVLEDRKWMRKSV